MVRKAYCCDASRKLFDDYYAGRQSGSGKPIFVGKRYQRGHGLGNILGGFERKWLLQLITVHGKQLLRNAVKPGLEIADDVIEGKKFKRVRQKRIPSGIKRTLMDMMRQCGVRAKRSRDIFA